MPSLRRLFLLDPDVVFLNHGSFGATPRLVFQVYQTWQRRLEHQPVKFLATDLFDHLKHARQALADFVHADADDLAFVPNTTFGINIVARSLNLGSGDEILATDHEYGACDNVWEFISRKTGASYVRQPIPLPAMSSDEIVEQLWNGVTPRTKVIFISHITSPTALHLPVEAICQRAREAGILTVIDGAHAPGQIPIDLGAIKADFYIGNCHKWLSAPKGSAFLYSAPDRQKLVEPLVVSWGWGENATFTTGSRYLDNLQWWGTIDPSAFLSVPAAIQFQQDHNWPAVRQRCHTLVGQAVRRICDLVGHAPLYPHDAGFYHQMAIAPLPAIPDLPAFKERLYEEYRVEVPCAQWKDQQFIRVSVQGYNTQVDIDRLVEALDDLLPRVTS